MLNLIFSQATKTKAWGLLINKADGIKTSESTIFMPKHLGGAE
jgi:hypothetical protein